MTMDLHTGGDTPLVKRQRKQMSICVLPWQTTGWVRSSAAESFSSRHSNPIEADLQLHILIMPCAIVILIKWFLFFFTFSSPCAGTQLCTDPLSNE